MGAKRLTINTDSQLVAKQTKGLFDTKEPRIQSYLQEVKTTMHGWGSIEIRLIDRSGNEVVDALARIGTTLYPSEGRWIQVEVIESTSTNKLGLVLITQDS